jgi:alpha-ketoglutarate-dependent taurine dioxygenase
MGTIDVCTPARGFGPAEVRALEPSVHPSDPGARAALRAALAEQGLLCVRFPRALGEAELRALAGMIGPIKDPIARDRSGQPLRYDADRQVIDAGFVLTDEIREKLGGVWFGGDATRPGLFEHFHTDDTYTAEPAAATVLHALELPPSGGGDTAFLDMRAAYDALEEPLRARLEGLRALHAYDNRGAFPPRPPARGPLDALEEVSHPIVRTHPVSGRRALYFDLDRACHVEGLGPREGRALLQELQDRAERSAPRYDHAWHAHDVLVWDNASVQHRAGGDFPVGEPRRFWRHLIAGGVPL